MILALAIIFTVAIPVGAVAAVLVGSAWSRFAVSNSDIAIGFTLAMAFAAVCAWIAAALS